MTTFNDAIAQAVARWWRPGRQMAFRVTCAENPQATLATCELWSTGLDGEWECRQNVPISGMETRLDLARGLVAARCDYPLTDSGEPRWRVDANEPKTYTLDVRRPVGGGR